MKALSLSKWFLKSEEDPRTQSQRLNSFKLRHCYGSYITHGLGGPVRIVMMSDIHCRQYIIGMWENSSCEKENMTDSERINKSILNVPKGDILIVSGDISQSGLQKELEMFNIFLIELSIRKWFKHICFIAGNHENTLDDKFYNLHGWRYHKVKQNAEDCREVLLRNLPPNVHYLEDSYVILEGLKIYGTPWVIGSELFPSTPSPEEKESNMSPSSPAVPLHFRWAFSITENEIIAKWDKIPNDIDILITHMPPFEIGDNCRNYDKDYINEREEQVEGYDHMGSVTLRNKLEQSLISNQGISRLQLMVFGHMHTGYGAYTHSFAPAESAERPNSLKDMLVGKSRRDNNIEHSGNRYNTVFVNAAVCDENYYPTQRPMVIDVNHKLTHADRLINNQYHSRRLDTAVAIMALMSYFIHSRLQSDVNGESNRRGEEGMLEMRQAKQLSSQYLEDALTPFDELDQTHVLNITSNIADFLSQHHLLHYLYDCRVLSVPGDVDSNQDFRSMQLVVPHLYIGSIYPALDEGLLKRTFGITHICSCICEEDRSRGDDVNIVPHFEGISYMQVSVRDIKDEDISKHFFDAISFIDNGLSCKRLMPSSQANQPMDQSVDCFDNDILYHHKNCNNVLVHCNAGMSRSATIVMAYLMFTMRISYSKAHALVARARPFVCPNQGFVQKLKHFEEALKL